MALRDSLTQSLSTAKTTLKQAWFSRHWPDRPESLIFEITAVCDARCIHCPRQEMDRPMKPMEFSLFQRMIDQAAELKIRELIPNGYGEILTVPGISKYFEHISSKAHNFRLIVNTNGHLMNEEKIEMFFKHNVHLFNITIDGATSETAQKVRVGLKTDRIEKNIHRILELRQQRGLDYPKIRVGMVLIPENMHEMDAFAKKWNGVADYVGFAGMANRAGSLKGGEDHEPAAPACLLPFRDLNIWADGKAVLCCQDWNEENIVGDLNTQTISEIWHGPEFTEVRRKHMAGRGAEVPICAKCNIWLAPTAGAKLWS